MSSSKDETGTSLPASDPDLILAAEKIRRGGVVAMPTETVYGLAASIDSEDGLKKIFAVKERPFFDPLIVHVASLKAAAKLARAWPPLADFVARVFWPGPLTLVLPKAASVHSLITSGLDTVAIRYPRHPLALELIRAVGSPLAAPSANKFGRTSPSQADHVRAEFPEADLLILDGGPCEVGVESTVITFASSTSQPSDRFENPDIIRILRPGGVTREMLEEALDKWLQPVRVEMPHQAPATTPDTGFTPPVARNDYGLVADDKASPGHLKHHYMPKIPLVIVPETMRASFSLAQQAQIKQSLIEATDDNVTMPRTVSFDQVKELNLSDDAAMAARELYAEMRRLSESGATCLIVRKTSSRNGGLWSAIWDRLSRAASFDFSVQPF